MWRRFFVNTSEQRFIFGEYKCTQILFLVNTIYRKKKTLVNTQTECLLAFNWFQKPIMFILWERNGGGICCFALHPFARGRASRWHFWGKRRTLLGSSANKPSNCWNKRIGTHTFMVHNTCDGRNFIHLLLLIQEGQHVKAHHGDGWGRKVTVGQCHNGLGWLHHPLHAGPRDLQTTQPLEWFKTRAHQQN